MRKLTIKDMQRFAEIKNGKCLSKTYVNTGVKLTWQCFKGHTWDALPSNVQKGSWCPTCGHNVGSIEEMRELAKKLGGECLSNEYLGANRKLQWICKNNHHFTTTPNRVRRGAWCRQCSDDAKKLTIEQMREIAKIRHGECLSDKYVNNSTNLLWRCEFGHEWWATPQNIRAGHWCTTCMRKTMGPKRLTIQEMCELAAEWGGKCLSTQYLGGHIKLRWKCSKGHVWEATPSSVKQRHWCPTCQKIKAGKKRRLGIEAMHELAKEKGGLCLSSDYVSRNTPLIWQCSKGHVFTALPQKVKNQNKWCPECSKIKRYDIRDMHNLARSRGGLCLSDTYTDNKSKLKWQCSKGHQWSANPGHMIHSNAWCPICAGKIPLTIEEMHAIASKYAGLCLSNEYTNARTKLHWQCADGHDWWATPDDVKNGNRWCPTCQSGLGERFCKELFERLFSKQFPKKRPKWLRNPETNAKMELDGFCEELGIAFEYQGRQHYEEVQYFQSDKNTLEKRKQMDQAKRNLCSQHNVILIEIPWYVDEYGEFKNVLSYILAECKKNNIETPNVNLELFNIDSFNVRSPAKIREMQELARSKGGEFLSNVYLGAHKRHLWQCAKGHIWETTPTSVKTQNAWCPKCYRENLGRRQWKYTIGDMQQEAAKHGGKCLSAEYIGNKVKLTWECSFKHRWEAVPSSILQGKWCPVCAGNRK